MIDVSIIIVTWNSERYVSRCLESIWKNTRGCSFEVIAVDSGSADGTVEAVRRGFPDVRVIPAGANIGFPKATNRGIRESCGKFLFLLNPDTELRPGAVERLAGFLRDHPEAGCVSPKIIETDGSVALFHVREFPNLTNAFFRHFGLRKIFPRSRVFGRETFGDWDYGDSRSVPCLHGAALMIPRATMEAVGELDEQLPLYLEDLDLCARIGKTGKLLYYEPSAVVVHHGGKSSELSPAQGLLHAMKDGQAPWLFLKKYRGPAASALFVLIVLAGSALRVCTLGLSHAVSRALHAGNPAEIKGRCLRARALLNWALSDRNRFMDGVNRSFR